MKKLLWIVGGFFVVLLVAIVTIPFFVSVDQYRPLIQQEASKRLNGKLELGKLSLSLWGTIKVRADSIRVTVNGFPQPLLDTQRFHLEVPILSLIGGKPQVVAVLDEPKIDVVKELDGRMNALELLKTPGAVPPGCPTSAAATAPAVVADEVSTVEAAPAHKGPAKTLPKQVKVAPKAVAPSVPVAPAPAPATPVPANCPPVATTPAAPAPTGESAQVPSLLAGARLGVRINKGDVHYYDKAAKSDYRIAGLDLDAKNLGLGSTMDVKIKAPLKGRTPSFSFEGPLEANAEMTPVLVGTSVRSARGNFEVDASALSLKAAAFHKDADVPLLVKGKLGGNEKETVIEMLEARLHDFKVYGKGRATLDPVAGELNLTADPMKLEKLRELVPMLGEYDLKGLANFRADIAMDASVLHANGDFKITDGSVFPKAYLKAPVQYGVQAAFTENSLSLTKATANGPDTDLTVTGSVKNFLAPQFVLAVKGKSVNVDKTLVLPGAGAAGPNGQPPAGPAPPPAGAPPAPGADVNPVASLMKNPIVAKSAGTLNADIGKVVVYGATLDTVTLRSELKGGELKASEASFRTFGGTVKMTGDFNLASSGLGFATTGNVAGISAAEAFKTYFPKFQNTLAGTMNAKWNVSGAAYPAAARIRNMRGSANLLAENGALKTIDVQGTINSIMQKVPFLKNRSPLQLDDGFKTMTADVKFLGPEIHVDPIDVQPRNKGFVLKGKSVIQENLEQETTLDVYDPQGQLPRDIQVAGKPALSLRLTGPISAPRTDYEYTVKKIAANGAQNALKNVAGKALGKFLGGQQNGQPNGNQDALKNAADKLKQKFKLPF